MGACAGHDRTIEQLNGFLRGELSAVRAYHLALDKLAHSSASRSQLESCLASHLQRVTRIRQRIAEFGGTPTSAEGAWGAFGKVIEGGGSSLGPLIAITALKEGEDHGLDEYRAELKQLDPDARQLVTSELLPQQEQTQRTLRALRRQLH